MDNPLPCESSNFLQGTRYDFNAFCQGLDLSARLMQTFADRYRAAFKRLEMMEGGDVTNLEMAERVAVFLERKPVSAVSASRWKNGAVPDLGIIGALAEICGVDPGWLAFGESTGAPAPDVFSSREDSEQSRPRRRASG